MLNGMKSTLLALLATLAAPSLAQVQDTPPRMDATPLAAPAPVNTELMAATAEPPVYPLEVLSDVLVTQIGTYQNTAAHYVWFSKRGTECGNLPQPVHKFYDNQASGNALLATLTSALISQRRLDVRVYGCEIYEIYIR